MEAVEVQSHTFLFSAPDKFRLSNTYRMDAVEVQLHTFLNSAPDKLSGQMRTVWRQWSYSSTHT